MHPGLPVVGVDFGEERLSLRQPVDVEAFAQVPNYRPGLRLAVEGLLMLLAGAATDVGVGAGGVRAGSVTAAVSPAVSTLTTSCVVRLESPGPPAVDRGAGPLHAPGPHLRRYERPLAERRLSGRHPTRGGRPVIPGGRRCSGGDGQRLRALTKELTHSPWLRKTGLVLVAQPPFLQSSLLLRMTAKL